MPHKLAPRSTACVLLGYPTDHRGYRCFDLDTRRVITSRHVTFDENSFPFRSAPCNGVSDGTVVCPTTDTVVIQELAPSRIQVPAHPDTPAPASAHMVPTPESPPLAAPSSAHPTPSASSSSPAAAKPPPAPAHSMITRAQAGIVKPNPRYALATTTSPLPLAPPYPLCQPRHAPRFEILTGTAPWNRSTALFRQTAHGVWLRVHLVPISSLANGYFATSSIRMDPSSAIKPGGWSVGSRSARALTSVKPSRRWLSPPQFGPCSPLLLLAAGLRVNSTFPTRSSMGIFRNTSMTAAYGLC